MNFDQSCNNISNVILSIFQYSGAIGNAIFFISSAWFLLDSEKSNKRKLLQIVLDAFTISVIFLLVIGFTYGFNNIPKKTIIKQFIPIYFSNNWYITFYLLFCLIVPLLNIVIRNINKRTHLIISVVFFLGYLVAGALVSFPFASKIILWTGIYFIVAYFKLYARNFCNNTKINLIMVICCLLVKVSWVIASNYLGLKINFFSNKLLKFWQKRECGIYLYN